MDFPQQMLVLENPKYARSIEEALRAATNYNFGQVLIIGGRYKGEEINHHKYPDVLLMESFSMLPTFNSSTTLIGVERTKDAAPLPSMVHPESVVYVFGPEDGDLSPEIQNRCHEIVQIPTPMCLQIQCAINVVLYDRAIKNKSFALSNLVT